MKKTALKIAVEIARIVLGATFVFSGFVKAVDPMGTAYKIEDYLTAFSMSGLSWLAFPVAAVMCILEFSLGVFLLCGIYRRTVTKILLVVMLGMTALTLYSAITNPVTDCGCFGDFLILSNWMTFFKNIVLLACAVLLTFKPHTISKLFSTKCFWLVGIYTILFITVFTLYNGFTEPVFDFRPYRIGADIPALTTVPQDKGPQYATRFVYKNNSTGKEQEFAEDNYPWADTLNWTFISSSNVLIKEGEEPKIHDFVISRLDYNPKSSADFYSDKEDITQQLLNDTSYTFLVISNKLQQIDIDDMPALDDLKDYCLAHNYPYYCLTASTDQQIQQWQELYAANFNYCQMDERALKTIVRGNPGLLLLKNGIVINKWGGNEIPQVATWGNKTAEELHLDFTGKIADTEQKRFEIILAVFLLPLLILKLLDFLIYRKGKNEKSAKKQ